MTAQRIAGTVALASGTAVALLLVVSALFRVPGPARMGPAVMGPGMMGGGAGMGDHMAGFGISGPAATAIPGAPEVRVTASNFALSPREIRLPRLAEVNVTLANPTALPHDLTVPGLGIHLVAEPGATRTIGLRALPAGRYDAFCSVGGHREAGMRAIVVVE